MSTLKIWDLHMKYDGPLTDEFLQESRKLAKSIAEEPGVLWKIWTREADTSPFWLNSIFSRT